MSQFILLKLNPRGKIIDVRGLPSGIKGKYFDEVFKVEEEEEFSVVKYNGSVFKMSKIELEDCEICLLVPEMQGNPVDLLPVGVAIIQDGEVIYSNNLFSELVGDRFYSFEFQNFISRIFSECLMANEVRNELEIQENGEERKLKLIASRGNYLGRDAVLCVLYDITKEKEFENLFLTLKNQAFVVVYIIQDGKFVFVNEMSTQLGYSLEELYRMDPFELVHPEDRERIIDNYVRRIAGEYVEVPSKFRLIAKDGRIFYVDAIAVRVIFGGRPAVMGMLIDRTKEMEAQEKLRMYERFFQQSKDMFFILDRDGRFIDLSMSYEEILGYSKDELLGNTSRLIAHEEDLPILRENFSKILQGESVKFTFRVKTKKGEERFVEVVEWPVFRNGIVVGAEGVLRDITDRLTTEDELKKTNQLLRTISEINEFILRERDEYALLSKVCRFFSKIREVDAWAWIKEGEKLLKATPLSPNCDLAEKAKFGNTKYERCDCHQSRDFSLGIPIRHNGNVFGVLVLCSVGELTDNEIKILEELGENLGFAISSYRAERDRKIAFNLLLENLDQLEALADKLRNPVAIISGFLEIRDDIGHERAFEEIEKQLERIKEILDELRLQETLTYFILRGEKYK